MNIDIDSEEIINVNEEGKNCALSEGCEESSQSSSSTSSQQHVGRTRNMSHVDYSMVPSALVVEKKTGKRSSVIVSSSTSKKRKGGAVYAAERAVTNFNGDRVNMLQRRGALTQRAKHPRKDRKGSQASLQHASTFTSLRMRHMECCYEVGDCIEVVSQSGNLVYALIRGLVRDKYNTKFALVSWLIPNPSNPPLSYMKVPLLSISPSPEGGAVPPMIVHRFENDYAENVSPMEYDELSTKPETMVLPASLSEHVCISSKIVAKKPSPCHFNPKNYTLGYEDETLVPLHVICRVVCSGASGLFSPCMPETMAATELFEFSLASKTVTV